MTFEKRQLEDNETNYGTIKDKKGEQFTPEAKIINQILDKYGYGTITLNAHCFPILLAGLFGLQIGLFGAMLIPTVEHYKIDDKTTKTIAALLYVGMAAGSLSLGSLSQNFGRLFIIKVSTSILTICSMLIPAIDIITVFIILRTIIGICLGILMPLSFNIGAEYLPTRFRSFALGSSFISLPFTNIYIIIAMLIVMPDLEQSAVPTVWYITTIFPIATFIHVLLFLENSPRHLSMSGEYDRAIEILEKMTESKFSESSRQRLIEESHPETVHKQTSIFDVFRYEYIRRTSLLIASWTMCMGVAYGTLLIQSLTFESLGKISKGPNRDIVIKQIYTSAAMIFSYIVEDI